RVAAAYGICGSEVERTEVDCIVGRSIDSVKCHADETLLCDVLATDVELDGSVTKLDSRQERDSLTGGLTQPNALSDAVAETAGAAVEELQALRICKSAEIGRDRFRLAAHAGNAGDNNHAGQRRDYELT